MHGLEKRHCNTFNLFVAPQLAHSHTRCPVHSATPLASYEIDPRHSHVR